MRAVNIFLSANNSTSDISRAYLGILFTTNLLRDGTSVMKWCDAY